MRSSVLAALAVLAVSVPATALASGSTGGGGGGGGYGAGANGFERASNPADEAYARGQRIFRAKFACKECADAAQFNSKDKAEVKAAATEIANRAHAGELGLSETDRDDLVAYLVQRYRLS